MAFFEKDKACLLPIDLFDIEIDIPFARVRPKSFSSYQFPSFDEFLYQDGFWELGIYYNDEGIGGRWISLKPFDESFYPDFSKGDALELFISTRNCKKSTSVTRFCHHFVILPVEIGGFYAKEITHFRGDDSRPISDPLPIEIKTIFHSKSFEVDFFIPKSALFGFEEMDPLIGINFIAHGAKRAPNYFSASSEIFNIPLMPSIWAQGVLEKKHED